MASFSVDKPVTTEVPEVVVDAGLKSGLHRFRLVVVDDTGQSSVPDEAVVQVGEEEVRPLNLRPEVLVAATPAPVTSPALATTLRPTLAPAVAPLRPTINPTLAPTRPTQPRTRRRPK